jgi:hypothetical protein
MAAVCSRLFRDKSMQNKMIDAADSASAAA